MLRLHWVDPNSNWKDKHRTSSRHRSAHSPTLVASARDVTRLSAELASAAAAADAADYDSGTTDDQHEKNSGVTSLDGRDSPPML